MDKVLKKEPILRGCLQLTQKVSVAKTTVDKTKVESKCLGNWDGQNYRALTCYGQYCDPLTMINNKPTFYADYADQVQVPDREVCTQPKPRYKFQYQDWRTRLNKARPFKPYTLPDWMARTSKFVLTDPVHQLPGKINYSNFLSKWEILQAQVSSQGTSPS